MTTSRKPRRTHEQWKSLIEQYHESSEEAEQFCDRHNVGHKTFCKWRQYFSRSKHRSPDLIELTAPVQPQSESWDIELTLGKDILLRLRSH